MKHNRKVKTFDFQAFEVETIQQEEIIENDFKS